MNFGYEKHKTCVLCFLFPVHIELNLLVWNFTSKCYLASESKLYLLENSYLDHREAIKRRAGDQIMWTNRKAGLGLAFVNRIPRLFDICNRLVCGSIFASVKIQGKLTYNVNVGLAFEFGLVLTIFNEEAYLTFKSIFHKALKVF